MTNIYSSKIYLDKIRNELLDPLGRGIAKKVNWIYLPNISKNEKDLYPVAIIGEGSPVLAIHGFDSSFLEYRRLVPLLEKKNKLIIPDLFGFGFCPRPENIEYNLEMQIKHLNDIIDTCVKKDSLGVIAASMGGTVALELARKHVKKINKLLLLSPAGVCTKPQKIPRPLDTIGTSFLKQKYVRRALCRQSFSNPNKSVAAPELEIASIHLDVPGWQMSLASFARNGGASNYGKPLPSQPINIIWGAQDRIINRKERIKTMNYMNKTLKEEKNCGHLPHLDIPEKVAEKWNEFEKS